MCHAITALLLVANIRPLFMQNRIVFFWLPYCDKIFRIINLFQFIDISMEFKFAGPSAGTLEVKLIFLVALPPSHDSLSRRGK